MSLLKHSPLFASEAEHRVDENRENKGQQEEHEKNRIPLSDGGQATGIWPTGCAGEG